MASAGTTPERGDEGIRDEFIREAEESGERRGPQPVRPADDHRRPLRRLRRLPDHPRRCSTRPPPVAQAAGVRINLWTGLFALAMGLCFIAWALLRPLRMEELAEAGVAEDEDDEAGSERDGAPRQARRPQH